MSFSYQPSAINDPFYNELFGNNKEAGLYPDQVSSLKLKAKRNVNLRMLKRAIKRGRRRSQHRRRTLLGYVEDADEPRTKLEARFSIRLPRDEPFDVIPQGKHHNSDEQEQADLLCNLTLPFA
jgi:hypothetical protein